MAYPFCLKKIVFFKFPFPLITPVLQEAPCAPRYEEGVAGDTQPVRPGGRWGVARARCRRGRGSCLPDIVRP